MKLILSLLALCFATQTGFAVQQCERDFFKTTFNNGRQEFNVLLIWFPTNAGSLSTLNVCSNETGLPLHRHCDYDRSNNASKWEKLKQNIALVNCSSIENHCTEEPFHHYYTMKYDLKQPFTNSWKKAKLMERADLKEPCLLSSGLPVTRLCEYNPQEFKSQWELLSPEMNNISCLRETREKIITYDLNTLSEEVKKSEQANKLQPTKVVKKMTELLQNSQTVRVPADIKLTSEILKIITRNETNSDLLSGVLNVTDIVMATDPDVVVKAEKVKATTTILKTVDQYVHKMAKIFVPTDLCHNITDGIVYKAFEYSSVFYINPTCSNISGVAIYNNKFRHHHRHQHFDIHTGNRYRFIYMNQTIEQILSEPDLRLATYFPLSLWNKLQTKTGLIDNQTVLAFTIFRNDLLFVNRTAMKQKPIRKILEISIPEYKGELPEDVPFILSYRMKSQRSRQRPNCGYWNSITWLTDGVRTDYKNISNNSLLICHSTHLTHFAAILGIQSFSQFSLGDSILLSVSHDIILDYISIIGCALSLIGLSCIWLTSICFRGWRAQDSNKVLLNMCLVLTLLMMFFLLLNLPQLWKSYIDMSNKVHCMIMGAYLHYNVLVLFFWMLNVAVMQYQRYVKVMGYERSSNFITKYALFAWGVPLIPTILVAYLDPHTYMPDTKRVAKNTAICYPSGKSLYYGVILPMSIIMLTNLAIFTYIFYSLRRSLIQFKQRGERKRIVMQVRITVLLFFLLGISWIFGFLSHLDTSPVFAYLFCLTSTLQGFVLFFYSIIIDKSTRTSWLIFCCAKSYNTMEDTSEIKRQYMRCANTD